MAHAVFLWESSEHQGDSPVTGCLPQEHEDPNSVLRTHRKTLAELCASVTTELEDWRRRVAQSLLAASPPYGVRSRLGKDGI